MVQGWLEEPRLLERKDTDRIAALCSRYAPYKVPANYMSKALPKGTARKVFLLLTDKGVKVSRAQCRNLASIKQVLGDHFNPPSYDKYDLRIEIARDGSHVIYNGKRYSVFDNAGTRTIKRQGKKIALQTILRVIGENPFST